MATFLRKYHRLAKSYYCHILDKQLLLYHTQFAPTITKIWGHLGRIVMLMRASPQTRPMTLHLISIEYFNDL